MEFRKNLLERSLILILAAVQGLVMVVGYLNYRKLNEIADYVKVPEKPAPSILLMREIVSELTEAERNAKSFYLTREGNYLSGYYSSVIKIANDIDRLDTMKWRIAEQGKNAEDLVALFEQELQIFNALIELDNNEYVTNELQTISDKVEKLKPDTVNSVIRETPVEEKKKKRKSIFRIFGKKENDTIPTYTTTTDTVYGNKSRISTVKKEIKHQVTKVKNMQTEELKRIKTEEFKLTAANMDVALRIRRYVNRIEESEQQELRLQNEKAAASAASAKETSVLFSALIITLLFITGFVITRYFFLSRRQRKSLRMEKKFAQEQAESKQNLVANMSHEMRTPLNSIIGFSEQVLQTPLAPEQHRQVSVVKKSADHLLQVINNMLDSSRLEAGKLQLNEIVFSPVSRLEDVVLAMTVQSREKKLELFSEISPDLPAYVNGDPVRFTQVVINILGNAIKYTEKGHVRLTADALPGAIRIRIADTGVGIPKEKQATIFNRYEQASAKQSGSGAGLGLSIARQLLELQGGSISLKSEPGQGTEVELVWPFTEANADLPAAKLNGQPGDPKLLAGKHVLVADDEQFNRMLLAAILKKYNITFTEAADGKQAITLLQEHHFDLVLMDVNMPEMNGLEVTEAIRKLTDPQKSGIPVIALTAGLESEKMKRCREAGMDEFLAKPYREADLVAKISRLLI